MKKSLLMILPALTVLAFLACAEEKKGNPQLVKDAQELARLGCECKDTQCLFDVKVNGQSAIKIRMSSGVKDMTDEEKTQFNAALNKWSECEMKLTQK